MIRLFGAYQDNVGNQVDKKPGVQLDVRMDCTNLENAIFQQLSNAKALRARKGKVNLLRDAKLEESEMLRTADTCDDEVDVVDFLCVDLHQRTRQEVRLLLVVAFHHDSVAGHED